MENSNEEQQCLRPDVDETEDGTGIERSNCSVGCMLSVNDEALASGTVYTLSREDSAQQVIILNMFIQAKLNEQQLNYQAMEGLKSTSFMVGALLACYFPLIGQLSAN